MAGQDFTCSIDGCNGAIVARQLCNKHYIRLMRHGSPLASIRGLNRSAPVVPSDGSPVVKSGRDRNKQVLLKCIRCGSHFHPRHTREESSKYCSEECAYIPTDDEVRDRLIQSAVVNDNGCWMWVGQTGGGGYGQTTYRGGPVKASRLAYTMFKGEIPKGLMVCHSCDVPRCINPDHLFLGTASDNMRDMVKKGRHGARKWRKLSDEQVRLIRSDSRPHRTIAAAFGISATTVHIVKTRKAYSDVTDN